MNSIKRGRRRPRVASLSFKVFAWVLVREAALRVLNRQAVDHAPRSSVRAMLCSVPTATLQVRVRRWLNFRPDRRVFP